LTPTSTHKGIPEKIGIKRNLLRDGGSTSWWVIVDDGGSTSWWVIVEEGIGKIKSYEFMKGEEEARWFFRQRRQARVLLCPPFAEEVSSSSGLNPLALKSIRAKLHIHRQAAQEKPVAQQEHLTETPANPIACSLRFARSAASDTQVEASPRSIPLLLNSAPCTNDTNSENTVQIVVASVSGKTLDMQVPLCHTIRDVKAMIGNAWGMFGGGLRLMHGTSEVANHTSLASLLPLPLHLQLSDQGPCGDPHFEFTALVDHELSLLAKVGLADLLEMRAHRDSQTLDQSEGEISSPSTPTSFACLNAQVVTTP